MGGWGDEGQRGSKTRFIIKGEWALCFGLGLGNGPVLYLDWIWNWIVLFLFWIRMFCKV